MRIDQYCYMLLLELPSTLYEESDYCSRPLSAVSSLFAVDGGAALGAFCTLESTGARFWTRSLSEFAAALPDDWRIVQLAAIGNSRMLKSLFHAC